MGISKNRSTPAMLMEFGYRFCEQSRVYFSPCLLFAAE
jgi:hypothetical protein